jgi:hypothetical protein
MPALGATDTADLVAKARTELGFSWQLGQPWWVLLCHLHGGSSGFSVWYCELQLERFNSGEEINFSQTSIYHWAAHLEPYRQTGNRAWSQIIGVDLLNHDIHITAWLDATLDDMAAFIFLALDCGGNVVGQSKANAAFISLIILPGVLALPCFDDLSI